MVKRVGNLMPRIADISNLQEAFLRAAKGKNGKKEVVVFRSHLNANLIQIQKELMDGCYQFGNYHFFTIYDPKERLICAAQFRDRVVFHAMMRICHPVFDHYQVFDSYASRIGKGTYKALDRVRCFAGRYRWFVKIDMCKYFDSIHHKILYNQLNRLFKDRQLLLLFNNLLSTYSTMPARGLPIGNLTSQYFANHYLSVADHYLKETLKVPAMVRYMDDVLVFASDRNELKRFCERYSTFVRQELLLEIHSPVLNCTKRGIPFLGYVVYADGLRLNRRSKLRFVNHLEKLMKSDINGKMKDNDIATRLTCMLSFVNKAKASGYLHQIILGKGAYLQGL